MAERKNDPAIYAALRDQVNPATGRRYTNREIGNMTGVDEASVRRGLNSVGYKPYLLPTATITRLRTELEKPLRVDVGELGAGAVTADWHHPLCDYDLVNTFIDHSRDIKATNWLVVAGDWFNVDSLSQFDYKQSQAGLDREMFASTETMEAVLKTFKWVFFSWGNHDARMHKALGYKVDFIKAMKMMFEDLDPKLLKRITFSNLDHVWIDTPRGPYYVAHPKTYSQVPLTSAIKLAGKKLSHVLTGHSHHAAVGYDRSGQFIVAELGGLHTKDPVEYLQRSTNFPEWTQGYGHIAKDGYFSLTSPGWSNYVTRGRG
jgi:hypothetical protein